MVKDNLDDVRMM